MNNIKRRCIISYRKLELQYLQLRELRYKENKYRYMEQLKVMVMLLNPIELFSQDVSQSQGTRKYLNTITAMARNYEYYELTKEEFIKQYRHKKNKEKIG